MKKNFDRWNSLKKQLTKKKVKFYFYEKEVWWCSLGMNIGFEENGKNKRYERPILVLKKFNKELLWALPLTSIVKDNVYYYQVSYRGRKYSVILSQIRAISSRRLLRKLRKIEEKDFKKIKKLLKSLLP